MHGTPWHIPHNPIYNADKTAALNYTYMMEKQMGGPLEGGCQLEIGGEIFPIPESCGIPPIWSQNGRIVAFPVWMSFSEQALAILDASNKEVRISEERFSLLHLREFIGNTLKLTDLKRELTLDINQLTYEKKLYLQIQKS